MTNLKLMLMVVATACGSMLDPAAHRQAVAEMLGQALAVTQPAPVSDATEVTQPPPAKKAESREIWGD